MMHASADFGEFKLWDVLSGRELLSLPLKGRSGFAFSPDGQRIYWMSSASESFEAELGIWDATPVPENLMR
jgi:hypothetical protein